MTEENKISIKILGCEVTIWKHTYRVILPEGTVFWGTSYLILEIDEVKKATSNLLKVFEAGKAAQLKIIRESLGIY